jgi:hypothetical protein
VARKTQREEWTPTLLDRLVGMHRWTGNYYIRQEMPHADEAEIQRVGRERWYQERNDRLIRRGLGAANWIGWGGAAVCFGLGFVWSPFFFVAGALLVGWFVLYVVVMATSLGWLGLRGVLDLFGLEIRRKKGS